MSTIRSRAIELSSDPKYFETNQPPQGFEDPGDAKLEADAHLAIVIDRVVQQLSTSDAHEQRFLSEVEKRKQRSHDDPEYVINAFAGIFGGIYSDRYVTEEVFRETGIGQKALQACSNYVEAASLELASGSSWAAKRIKHNIRYSHPEELVAAGLRNFATTMGRVVWGLNMGDGVADMDSEARQKLLESSSLDLLKLGSLSLHQHREYMAAGPIVQGDRLSIAPDIEVARGLPLYSKGFPESIRPHRGCPAMPNLPTNMILHGGSSIHKLYQRASGLIVAMNMHILVDPQTPFTQL